jgi:hypothetical protein
VRLPARLVHQAGVLALIWAYLHHFIAGVRHLWMDATHSVTKEQGRSSGGDHAGLERAAHRWRWAPSSSACSEAFDEHNFGSKRIVVGAHYGCATGSASASRRC